MSVQTSPNDTYFILESDHLDDLAKQVNEMMALDPVQGFTRWKPEGGIVYRSSATWPIQSMVRYHLD